MKASFQITKLDYWVYGISIALCFLLFKQSDLTVTNNASFAYLHGHFWDFYDYNKTYFDNNYLPIFYWIFALWNLPLKLLGFIPQINQENWLSSTPIVTIWSKLLLAIFFFATVNLVGKVADQICEAQVKNQDIQKENLPKLFFATSPIAIFAVFIFGGYDIFALFFMLLGLRAYFTKDFKWFVLWFSVAISFKYFAAFAYLPLVLIIEKRFIHLVIYGLLGLAVTTIQFALYWHSDVFLGEIFGLVTAKAAGNGFKIRSLIVNLFYCSMCFYIYFSKFDYRLDSIKWCERAIYACLLSYALLFSWVLWHPQWIILITPFVCFSFLFIRSQKLLTFLLVIEILGYLGFAAYTMNNWAGNVDNTMLYGGVFGELLPHTNILVTDVIGRKSMALSRVLFYGSLYVPFLVFVYECLAKKSVDPASNNKNSTLMKPLLRTRFLVACYFIIGLTAACFIST
ncbi:hypothetical protein G6703_01585 [Polynucleobacter paneuropaeus]|jgi:hypothetical protein|nr:hypothetical protein G6703_01585 [Polynucleobacter paneuropaeus]